MTDAHDTDPSAPAPPSSTSPAPGDPAPALAVVAHVRSRHTDPEHTPIQPPLNPDDRAEVHIEPAYADALDGIDEMDFLWLLSWLARPGQPLGAEVPLRQVPFLRGATGEAIGVLAMRGPRRPTPIGLHLVQLLGVDRPAAAPVLHIAGVDLLDGTPIVDIKPYVPAFDTPYGPRAAAPRAGWFDRAPIAPGATPASLRQPPS